MAHVLDLTDGTTTVNLATNGNLLLEYVPRSPELSTIDFTPEALRDGGERPVTTRRNVTESARVLFVGASIDAVRTTIRTVETLCRAAEHYQATRVGSPVYVQFTPDGDATTYRSEVLSGRVELADTTLQAAYWGGKRVEALVVWTRRYYWEGPETAVPLSNANGSNVTTGLTIYNHYDNDAGHQNWADIGAASIAGAIPAGCRIEIQNTDWSSITDVWIGLRAWAGDLSENFESDAAVTGTGASGRTDTASASASRGSYSTFTWSSSDWVQLCRWEPNTAFYSVTRGTHLQMLLRTFSAVASGIRAQIKVLAPPAIYAPLLAGPAVELDPTSGFQELGAVMLPPYLAGVQNVAPPAIGLYVQKTGGGSLAVDYVGLVPTDSYRRLSTIFTNVAVGDKIIEDSIAGRSYHQGSTGQWMSAIGRGSPILLWPGKAQRLHVFFQNGASAAIGNTVKVWLYYRARRLTL